MESRKKLGEFLKGIAKARNIRNNTLAIALNVSAPYISQIYSGISVPSKEQFERLMKLFNLNLAEEEKLTQLYVTVKTGLAGNLFSSSGYMKNIKRNTVPGSAIEQILLIKFKQLTNEQRFSFLCSLAENTNNTIEDCLLMLFEKLAPEQQTKAILALDQYILSGIKNKDQEKNI